MRVLAVILFIVCCCSRLIASSIEFYQSGMKHYTQENGLANNTLFTIHQDKKGFLWLGTDVGISRYDGVHFHNYELSVIEPQAIQRICEMEQDSLLWLKLGRYNKIACFDKTNGNYIPLKCATEGLLSSVYDLCIADSVLYILTPNGIESVDYQFSDNSIEIKTKLLTGHKYPLKALDCDDNNLYALDEGNNILIYNYRNQKQSVLGYHRLQTTRSVETIHAMNGYLWITTNWNGTYCYMPESNELRRLESSNGALENTTIVDVAMKNDSTFFAATPNSILRINFSGTDCIQAPVTVSEIPFDKFMYDSFIKNRVTSLYVDAKNSVIWLSTFGKGLLKSNIIEKDINRIFLPKDMGDINGIAEDVKGYVWLSTEHHGIWRSTDRHVSMDMKFQRWEHSSDDGYYCMYKEENGKLWIADETGIVYLINPLTTRIEHFKPKYDSVNSIGSIYKIYYCIHNRLWLVSEKGLFIYDHQNDKCLGCFPYDDAIYKITTLCEDRDGLMWLGTNDGIRTAQLVDNEIKLSNGLEQKAGISKSEVLHIYMNRYNQLYIAYTDKIIQTDGPHGDILDIKILQKDITSGHVQCIIDDKSGNTWMGNNVGIMTVNNKSKASYTYSFPERFYNVCQLEDGRLLWNNSSGLMYFDPVKLKMNSLSEQLYISDIGINYNMVDIGEEINGQTILERPIYQLEELDLNHSNNNVIFYLTNLNYNQMPNKIEYRLLPMQTEWETSYKAEVEYSNIQPGEYTLQVRPISIIDEETPLTQLKIRIKKHWAMSGGAIACYLLFICLFIALSVYYMRAKASRRKFYKRKEELLKDTLSEEIKNRKEESTIQRLCNTARYNLIRELRTPLSLVAASLKEMANASALPTIFQPKMKIAYRNSVGMQNIFNLMQEIYEQENENLKLNVASYPVMEIIHSAIASSNELLNVASIKLHYDKNKQLKQEIWIDRRKIDYILRNVLSNAYRHISYSGNVMVDAFFETINGKEYCCYQIKDDGKDMIEESATYLLSKEEGGNELVNQLHPELGIILMKEHITAHHGDIRIEQDKENGSCVSIYIPLGKEHFEDDPRVVFVEPESIQPVKDETHPIITAEEKEEQIKEEQENMSLLIPPTDGKHKILVIEDHKDIRLYLKVLFSSEYTVLMAENGEEGVKMARREMPDIILSDVMMPVMDGFEVTRILKEDLKTCHIPIIILTALSGDTNAVKGLDIGADDYILKPFNAEILRSKVKRHIENRQNLKQAYMKLMMTSGTKESENEDDGTQKEDPFIRQIFEIVENNLQNPDFNVKRLAEMVNMSQPTLYRRVKMLTNYTIIELIRGVRLKNAAELLRTKKYSIQEVSEMVGYNDAPTFRKHFVDFYGTTPSTFANKEEASDKKKVG